MTTFKRADTAQDSQQSEILIKGVDYNKIVDALLAVIAHAESGGNPHGSTPSDIGAAAALHTHTAASVGAATAADILAAVTAHVGTTPHITLAQARDAAPVQSVIGLSGAITKEELKAALALVLEDLSGQLDASKIAGVLPLSALPPSVVERLYVTPTDASRFSLTKSEIQNGDTVKVVATERLYLVVNDNSLNSEAGYMPYSAAPQGPQGPQGIQGVKGDKGDKGDQGDPGPAGAGSGDMLAATYDPDGDGKIAAAQVSGLSTVATTGSYSDLAGKPDLSLKADLVAGKIPAGQLPSFVDDVLEFANLAAFPATGESGKLYVAVNSATAADPSKSYRWSGTVYTEISPSPGSTTNVPEGTNLYFTAPRAAAAAPVQSVAGHVGIVSTGQISLALGLGTAATANTPASGNAAAGEVVKGSDTRLSDARTPTAHNHAATGISDSTATGRALITAADAATARAAIEASVAMAAPVVVATNTTLASNSVYSYSAAGLTLTLPASPNNGDRIVVFNTGVAASVVVARNGKTIMGLAEDMTLDMPGRSFEFTYISATGDWRVS